MKSESYEQNTPASGVMILAVDGLIQAVSSLSDGESSERFTPGTMIFDYFDSTSAEILRDCMTRSAEQPAPTTCWPVCTSTSRETLVFEAQIVSFPVPSESERKYALRWRHSSPSEAADEPEERAAPPYTGRSVRDVAHDLNNYLSTIISFSGFLMDDILSGDSRRSDVHEILEAANQASKLTDQLLESEPAAEE